LAEISAMPPDGGFGRLICCAPHSLEAASNSKSNKGPKILWILQRAELE
jgi:hypothetical protein